MYSPTEKKQTKDAWIVPVLTTKKIKIMENIPTSWFKIEQIETWIGESVTTEGKSIEELNGGRGKLIVLHQCGENKKELISQLETLIHGLKEGFDAFAS